MDNITVIIPSYNRAHLVPRAVNSILAQTYPNWDLILVDDGSTDQTQEYFSKLIHLHPQRVSALSSRNRGVSHARNLAIDQAKGDWLAFLDSDDEWLPQKLERQIEFSKKNPDIKFFHTNEIWIRDGVRVNAHKKFQKFGGWIFEKCLPFCTIGPSTTLIHKSVFQTVGYFREDFVVCEDYDLWLKICAQYEVGFVDEFLVRKYGGHADQLSHQFFAMDYWRIKSLGDMLTSKHLKKEQKIAVAKMITMKSEILLNGYRKHQNLENFAEINEIQTTALQYF